MKDKTIKIAVCAVILLAITGMSFVISRHCQRHKSEYQQNGINRSQYNPHKTNITWGEILNYIWMRESYYGRDPKCKLIGKHGERGEYQITPIFIEDVKRISGYTINPYDNQSCRKGIKIWLKHYIPLTDARTKEEIYELYRRGLTGYKRWRERRK
ncbi:MAG: hypothetical protein DRN20_03475 [Thermoplasmata archaeon]|nr:MAG: hypothetical protein DRN20_03475 [Thermoplasmata archaeon]